MSWQIPHRKPASTIDCSSSTTIDWLRLLLITVLLDELWLSFKVWLGFHDRRFQLLLRLSNIPFVVVILGEIVQNFSFLFSVLAELQFSQLSLCLPSLLFSMILRIHVT